MDNQMIVVFLCVLALGHCAESFSLVVSPTEIIPSLTRKFAVNCTFNNTAVSSFSTLLSLSISKSEVKNQQPQKSVELLSLNALANDRVSVLSEIYNASVSGHVGTGDDAYLSMQWSYPSGVEAGLYQCEARGMDDIGRIKIITENAQVTTDVPSLEKLIDKVGELQSELDSQTKSNILLENRLEQLEKNKNVTINGLRNLTTAISSLQSEAKALVHLMKVFYNFELSDTYKNRYYLLSKWSWSNASVAELTCEKMDGYLAEINDSAEHAFIKSFLDRFSGFDGVLLGGTDEAEEGKWVFNFSGQPMNYTDWDAGEPANGPTNNCLAIVRYAEWKMYDQQCTNLGTDRRHLCEVPCKN